jgi:hypothetical protein
LGQDEDIAIVQADLCPLQSLQAEFCQIVAGLDQRDFGKWRQD